MVANVRSSLITLPDPAETQARESIVDEWTKLRARRRAARGAVMGLAAFAIVVAAAAVLLRVSSGVVDRPPESGAIVPPPAAEPVPVTSPSPSLGTVIDATTSVQSARGAGPQAPPAARP